MIRLDIPRTRAPSSLNELLEIRRRLRRQEICLESALIEAERELGRALRRKQVDDSEPQLQRLCEGLRQQVGTIERDLQQVRAAHELAAREVAWQLDDRSGEGRRRA